MKLNATQPLINAAPVEQNNPSRTGRIDFSTTLKNTMSTHYDSANNSMRKVTPPTSSHHSILTQQSKPQASLNERALGLRAYRQELLASNIANADTPGYRAVDIDVSDALKSGKTREDVQVQYRMPEQGSIDGNTVSMDVERTQFAQNAVMYEYTVDRVRGRYKEIDEILKNTPY